MRVSRIAFGPTNLSRRLGRRSVGWDHQSIGNTHEGSDQGDESKLHWIQIPADQEPPMAEGKLRTVTVLGFVICWWRFETNFMKLKVSPKLEKEESFSVRYRLSVQFQLMLERKSFIYSGKDHQRIRVRREVLGRKKFSSYYAMFFFDVF